MIAIDGSCLKLLSWAAVTTQRNCPSFGGIVMARDGQQGNTSNRGFASMDAEKQREIASKGGKAAHRKGTAHEFTSAEAAEAGRKGGMARAQNRARQQELERAQQQEPSESWSTAREESSEGQ